MTSTQTKDLTSTMLLTHEVYGSEGIRADRKTSPFGFQMGQMRSHDLVHNGGWYNGNGERLGWGDLSPKDLQKISEEIPEGESFFILSEQDSFWKITNLQSCRILNTRK
jgi:hypothetical protein